MTADERAALIEGLRVSSSGLDAQIADLIEMDGKLIALANAAPHDMSCEVRRMGLLSNHDWECTCWKAKYDATKKEIS